ncbi:hypothetical protein BJX96DRAFT_141696 [Aspergillus floccosus]
MCLLWATSDMVTTVLTSTARKIKSFLESSLVRWFASRHGYEALVTVRGQATRNQTSTYHKSSIVNRTQPGKDCQYCIPVDIIYWRNTVVISVILYPPSSPYEPLLHLTRRVRIHSSGRICRSWLLHGVRRHPLDEWRRPKRLLLDFLIAAFLVSVVFERDDRDGGKDKDDDDRDEDCLEQDFGETHCGGLFILSRWGSQVSGIRWWLKL